AHHVAHALHEPGPGRADGDDPRDEHDGALKVGGARDLALLAGFLALLGCCLLGLLAGHQATRIAWRAAPTSCCSSLLIHPATKGRVAATSRRPTTILAGKPTSMAEMKIEPNTASTPPTRWPRAGAWSRPTMSYVRARPCTTQPSPPMAMKMSMPTSE